MVWRFGSSAAVLLILTGITLSVVMEIVVVVNEGVVVERDSKCTVKQLINNDMNQSGCNLTKCC